MLSWHFHHGTRFALCMFIHSQIQDHGHLELKFGCKKCMQAMKQKYGRHFEKEKPLGQLIIVSLLVPIFYLRRYTMLESCISFNASSKH